jgi:hypothetical protein
MSPAAPVDKSGVVDNSANEPTTSGKLSQAAGRIEGGGQEAFAATAGVGGDEEEPDVELDESEDVPEPEPPGAPSFFADSEEVAEADLPAPERLSVR